MSSNLKPCPFCGEDAKHNFADVDFVSCKNRDCDLYDASIQEDYWNNRPSVSLEKCTKALRDKCESNKRDGEPTDDYDVAMAVLAAAGVPYVD